MKKADLPTGFFPDLLEDFENFFLLLADDEALGCNGKRAKGNTCYTTVLDVGCNATDLMGVV